MKRLRVVLATVLIGYGIYLGIAKMALRHPHIVPEKNLPQREPSVRPAEDVTSPTVVFPRKHAAPSEPGHGAPSTSLLPEISVRPEAEIWQAYQSLATNRTVNLVAHGLQMLGSTNDTIRMTGAIFLIEAQRGLDQPQIERIAADEAVVVPLTALGWLRDAGLYACAGRLETTYLQRANALDRTAEALRSEWLNATAGRAALRLIDNSGWNTEKKRELMLDVLSDPRADYIVRWHAALLLRYQMDFSEYQAIIQDTLKAGGGRGGSIAKGFGLSRGARQGARMEDHAFRLALLLVNERTAGPVEMMAGPVTLTKDDADLFFAHESPLMLDNLAAWLDLATEKHGFVSVKRGFTAAVRAYLSELPRQDLMPGHALTLRRIESLLPTVELLTTD